MADGQTFSLSTLTQGKREKNLGEPFRFTSLDRLGGLSGKSTSSHKPRQNAWYTSAHVFFVSVFLLLKKSKKDLESVGIEESRETWDETKS